MKTCEITSLINEWSDALKTGDVKVVASLYASDAILLPTISNQVRHNHLEIEDYFVNFLSREPNCSVDETNIRIFGKLAINSGTYNFTFNDRPLVFARFTFVYRFNGKRWMIIEHHSSEMPE